MAFTYSIVAVGSLAVGDQVRAVVCADGHSYVFPVPTTGGASFPTTVRAIFAAPLPPGASAPDGLTTVQLNNSSAFALPTDFTINGSTDFVVKATGTA